MMATYATLARWTDQVARTRKEGPRRWECRRRAVEEAGGRLIGAYLTLGRFDMVFLTEFSNEEAATTTLPDLGAAGKLRAETRRAFTAAEEEKVCQRHEFLVVHS
jgi:uncharacterized protein with GYD domain